MWFVASEVLAKECGPPLAVILKSTLPQMLFLVLVWAASLMSTKALHKQAMVTFNVLQEKKKK